MRVYIAGPYGDTNSDWKIQQNVDRADETARNVLAAGHNVFCPHKMTHRWEKDTRFTTQDFIDLDLSFISLWADCILRIPGESKGADIEVDYARMLRLPIYDLADFPWSSCNRT